MVGIAEGVKAAYPDPPDKEGKAVTVDVKAVEPVKQPVTLAAIKADPKFKEFKLVRQSRLSVVAVSDEHWKLIMKMSGGKRSATHQEYPRHPRDVRVGRGL